MFKSNVTSVVTYPLCPACGDRRLFDNGYAIFAPPGRGMSHNGRTLQDVGLFVLMRQLTRLNGGPGVRKGSAATPAIEAEFRLTAGHFVVGSIHSGIVG